MVIKAYWTNFAKSELHNIFEYYYQNASPKTAQDLVTGIVKHTKSLSKHRDIGAIEPLLEKRQKGFRCLIFKNYKIVYWYNTEKKRIDITDVFDTRDRTQ